MVKGPSPVLQAAAGKKSSQKPALAHLDEWLLKAEYSNGSSRSFSSIGSSSICGSGEVLVAEAGNPGSRETSSATSSTAELRTPNDQRLPSVPLWFHLRNPGRFAPWTKKSARLLEHVQFYNQDWPVILAEMALVAVKLDSF
ncbi:hypothetical protein WJX74_005361 [Apatococcus lobatus]|uniref:Uncharacterized protein n=1 Tax=Apatococcus lobatus TaxID=904363 RepID=A0AAW1RL99_9CHLO